MVAKELAEPEKRLKALDEKMKSIRAGERTALKAIQKGALERIEALEQFVSKARDAEGPFLMCAEEDLPLERALLAVRDCEIAITASGTAASIAKVYLTIKGMEVKKFVPALSQEGTQKIKECQTKMDEIMTKLNELKAKTGERKKMVVLKECQQLVQKAEDAAKQVTDAAASLEDEKLATLTHDEIQAATDGTMKAEGVANFSIKDARNLLNQRQSEAKDNSAMMQELAELQQRVDKARQDTIKQTRLCSTVENRLRALSFVDKTTSEISNLEEQVGRMSELVTKVVESDLEGESLKQAEETSVALQKKVRLQKRELDDYGSTRDEAVGDAAAKLLDRLKPVLQKCEDALTSVRAHSQKVAVRTAMAECARKVGETEAAVKLSKEAEEAFQTAAKQPEAVQEEATAMANLESAIKAANSLINSTKALLSLKRVDMKRQELSGTSWEELDNLQKRLDDCTQQLAEHKKVVADRQNEVTSREMSSKLQGVQKLVEAYRAQAATMESLSPEQPEWREAGEQLKLVADAVTELDRLADCRLPRHGSSEILSEKLTILKQVEDMKAELEGWQKQFEELQARNAIQKLIKESFDLMDALEKKMQSTEEIAGPLSDKAEDISAVVFLKAVVEALQQSFERTAVSPEAAISSMLQEDKVVEQKFVSELRALPELQVENSVPSIPLFSEQELKAAYRAMCDKEQTEACKSRFLDFFKTRYTCVSLVTMTDRLAVKGSKTLRKLALYEVLDALEDPLKDEVSGLMRVKVKAEKDGTQGYVTLQSLNGTTFIKSFLPHQVMMMRVESSVEDMNEALTSTAKQLDAKLQVTRGSTGPLGEVKAEMTKLRPRIAEVQTTLNSLKKKLFTAKKLLGDFEASESTRKQEALDRHEAEKITNRAKEGMDLVRPLISEVLPAAESLKNSSCTVQELVKSETALEDLYQAIVDVRKKMQDDKTAVKYVRSGPLAEVWDTLSSFLAEIWTPEEDCTNLLYAVQEKRRKLIADAQKAVSTAIREAAAKDGSEVEVLFDKLRKDNSSIPMKELLDWIGEGLKAGEVEVGLERYAVSGVSKLSLTLLLQDYMRCIKEISMTTEFEVKNAKTVKKLSVGDYVKVLEPIKSDEQGMTRVRCQAINDLTEGWVSLKGSQGTSFLERCAKPYLCCRESSVLLHAEFDSASPEVRKLLPGQVIEVLEGPKREAATECLRVRGKAVKDGKIGYVAMKDAAGHDILEPIKVLVCRTSTALTTGLDVSASKTVRRVEAGEVFEALDEAQEDEKRKLSRVKVRTWRDDKEGWVTLMGNSGTTFVEASDQHHVVKKTTPLEATFRSGSFTLRLLEEHEVFEMLEPPKTEKKEGDQRMRGRSASSEGWFTFSKFLTPWSPRYRCIKSTNLTESLSSNSNVVRPLANEMAEALELPSFDETSGLVRVRVRAEKDNILGYATLRETQGEVYLEALAPEKPER